MYKLLTTTAVILAVATPSLAWDGAKALTQKLDGIYTNLDGNTGQPGGNQFDTLQGEYKANSTGTGNNGQLSNFFNKVDQGVTYITITVDANNNIQPGINPGVAFSEIQSAKDELVHRVNYDLFNDTDEANYKTYDANDDTTHYEDAKNQGYVISGSSADAAGENDYSVNQNGGLAGVKISNLVANTNTINDFLIAGTTDTAANTKFKEDFANQTGSITFIADPEDLTKNKTVDLATGFFGQINSLNAATNIASNAVFDEVTGDITSTGSFFEGIDLTGATQDVINNFAIPSYNSYNDIGVNGNPGGYISISNWANEIQTVVTTAGTGTLASAGVVAIVDSAAGTITVDGAPYTLSGGVFEAD